MSRDNFYHLLGLKINPPESDPQVITAAIKQKQAEWSRLRNHPTKGTQARQYISLLTEIRNVMGDAELREKEARAALDLLKKKLEAKFAVIDEHVRLLGCKGEITGDEVERLARHHKVKPHIIQRRIERWQKKDGTPLAIHLNRLLVHEKPDEKAVQKIATQFSTTAEDVTAVLNKLMNTRSAELDAYISIQIRKGFMLQKEISSIAELYTIDQGQILRRVRCPIKKKSEDDADSTYRIDGTVEQVINENLKIVEHDSLYSFLGLFQGSSLEALQNKAIEKENAIRKIAQKDAVVTASGVLAGQCISIFKTDESRYAYDLSRARALLKKLNIEMDLAVNNDAIGMDYYHHLLRKAVSFGTSPDEARQHILDYCRSKNWTVDIPKKKLNLKRYSKIAFVTLSVFLIAGSVFWYFYFSKQRLEEEYLKTVSLAGKQPTLEAQIRVFETYLSGLDQADLRERAKTHIESLQKRMVQRNYTLTAEQTDRLYEEEKYEEIDALYAQFLAQHAGSAWADKILEKRTQLPALIDDRDYKRITAIPSGQAEEIAHSGYAYLRKRPDGKYQDEVRKIVKKAAAAYYGDVVNALKQCEKAEDWNQCILLCSRYIDVYRDSSSALKLKERRDQYQINLQNKNTLDSLKAQAGGANARPEDVRVVYEDFLKASPYSPAANLVRSELAEINLELGKIQAQEELKKLSALFGKKGSRFTIKKDGTFYDSRTGLTWALLDSKSTLGKCMTYEEAGNYVKTMVLGGWRDWRLPKTKEITGLYSGSNPFPGTSAAWYWSANSHKRYSGGWIIKADTVSPASQVNVSQKDSNDCGWFRAVRR
jgi:hypothetical protein